MAVIFIIVFSLGAPVFTESFGRSILAGGFAAAACGVYICRAVLIFFESSLMIKSMPAFLEEAKYMELNDEEYGVVCRESAKFKKIYAIAASEPKEAPAPAGGMQQ